MNLVEWTRIAMRSIGANKLRSFLTTLGIIIGVAAVISLVSVGQGAARSISSTFESMGSHLIIIRPVRSLGGELFVNDARELEERVPSIEYAVPSLTLQATVKYQTKSHNTTVEGVSEGLLAVRNWNLDMGRFLSYYEVEQRSRVAVLGWTVVNEIFGSQQPLGQVISIKGQPFTVIGVMERRGSSFGMDSDDIIYIPVTVAQRLSGSTRLNTIYAKGRSAEDAQLAVSHIAAIYSQKFPRPDAVRITSQDELLSAVGDATRTFTLLLAAIAGISLVVGGIGIMNIMLVSVTERTREIGIRKAIGARRRDILGQFLIESIVLSMTGGVIGMLAGTATSRAIARIAGWSTYVSPEAILLAFVFSVSVGLFFGVYPARKAAAMDPIEALRHE
ncbi:MAG: ABC transporter permease [Bacillota bacterium]